MNSNRGGPRIDGSYPRHRRDSRCVALAFSWWVVVTLVAFGILGDRAEAAEPVASSYTLKIPREVSPIANHLNRGQNTLHEVLPSVPDGTLLYKFDGIRQIFTVNQFQLDAWLRPQETLAPGEGAFIRNPGEEFSLTFTGTKPDKVQTSGLVAGYNLISLATPGESTIAPEKGGEKIWQYQPTVQGFRPHTYDDLDRSWIPPVGRLFSDQGISFIYQKLGTPSPEAVPGGTLYFSTRIPGLVNAPVLWDDGTGVGPGFTAQLYGGPANAPPDQLVPLFPTTSFQTSRAPLRGYVAPVVVTMPAISANNTATVVMRVYNGASYETSSLRAETLPITVRVGGTFWPPGNLNRMEGISIPRPAGSLRFERTSSGLTLTYTGTLQSADAVTGPYTDVPGASSPATVMIREGAKFFRVKP